MPKEYKPAFQRLLVDPKIVGAEGEVGIKLIDDTVSELKVLGKVGIGDVRITGTRHIGSDGRSTMIFFDKYVEKPHDKSLGRT